MTPPRRSLVLFLITGASTGSASSQNNHLPEPGTAAAAIVSLLSKAGVLDAINAAGPEWHARWKHVDGKDPRPALQQFLGWLHVHAYEKSLLPARANGIMTDKATAKSRSLARSLQGRFLSEQVERLRASRFACLPEFGGSGCACFEWDGTYMPWLKQIGICSSTTSYVLKYSSRRSGVDEALKLVHGDIHRANSFLPSSLRFDLVWCTQVFEHVLYPHVAFKQLARLTKPGGFISWSAPFMLIYHGVPQDYFRYTHQALLELAKDAGLRVDGLYGVGDRKVTVGSMQGFGDTFFSPADLAVNRSITRVDARFPTHSTWYFAVFADIVRPLTPPSTRIDYESPQWLFSNERDIVERAAD